MRLQVNRDGLQTSDLRSKSAKWGDMLGAGLNRTTEEQTELAPSSKLAWPGFLVTLERTPPLKGFPQSPCPTLGHAYQEAGSWLGQEQFKCLIMRFKVQEKVHKGTEVASPGPRGPVCSVYTCLSPCSENQRHHRGLRHTSLIEMQDRKGDELTGRPDPWASVLSDERSCDYTLDVQYQRSPSQQLCW
ncbi:hypothetical protein E5288_WYG012158 [Bos mutus]|uniref:Uncharacterized protein n=1 Tax=Bos mutus TaxID=72004 RepID=A0A6B0R3E1_9CETA|nr:hypothetical protein [Bos mutus]